MLKKVMLVLVTLCFTTLAFAETSPAAVSAEKSKELKYLFLIHACRGKISISDTSNNNYQIVLHKVIGAYLADRPAREVGRLDINQFVETWDKGEDSFKTNNPNAALYAGLDYKVRQKQISEFVVLSNPVYDAKKNDLTFDAKPMSEKTKLTAGALKEATLFIDDHGGFK